MEDERARQVLVLFVLLLLPSSGYAACDQVDHDSLFSLAFKFPLNWSASIDCCSWEGVSCSQENDHHQHVVRLWLPGKGLTGAFPPAIKNLTHLTHLNLSYNSLLGSLPHDLFSSLQSLQVIDLSFNRLKGHVPVSSNESSQLQILNLSSNFFDGTIPSAVLVPSLSVFNVSNNSLSGTILIENDSNHTSLTMLDLSMNKFTNQIPLGIGSCSKLQVFRAGFNDLSGSLPDEILNLVDLQQLSLPVNSLSGTIGNGIMNLTNLKILELFSNIFSGPIPGHIGNLFRLEKLLLHNNNFTGPLPSSLTNCSNLSTLNFRLNNLSGHLSAFNFSAFQQLTSLDLGNNYFSGEIPQSLYSCKSLTAIRLARNQLTGQISPLILALQSLAYLSISSNKLTNATGAFRILTGCKKLSTLILAKNFRLEPLPNGQNLADPDAFLSLRVFALGGCQFTGPVPTWLAKLKNLHVLDLSRNLITGFVPGWLGSLPNLFYLDLSSNLFTGGIPKELCGMPGLTLKEAGKLGDLSYLELPMFVQRTNATDQLYKQLSNLPPALYLGNNSLNGNIPTEIGQLKFIHVLDLSHNNFTGGIPNQLSKLSNLERLDLSYNHLSGGIPTSLKSLNFLSFFSVAYNDLQGVVPSGGQFDTFAISSFEGNPRLCGLLTAQRTCPPQLEPVDQGTNNLRLEFLTVLITAIGYCIGFGFGFCIGTSNKKLSL